jgi:hypothetical protein
MRLVRTPKRPQRSPVISIHAKRPEYRSWKQFLDTAYWHVELRD